MQHEGLIGWAAGIIDGEGTIKISHTSGCTYAVYLTCTMTHKPTLDRLKLILKCGEVNGPYAGSDKSHRNTYCYSVASEPAVQAIKLLKPYLLTKQAQANLAVEFHETCLHVRGRRISTEVLALREVLYEEMAALNKKGKS